MTTFRQYDDVAVVEHDDRTRQPREGGQVHRATVTAAGDGSYIIIRYAGESVNRGRPDQFWSDSGWRAWDGEFRWRLVPLCRCERPILGTPVTAEDGPLNRQWCSEECLTAEAEASYEQRYQPGVAT